jgi:hypothetical protein
MFTVTEKSSLRVYKFTVSLTRSAARENLMEIFWSNSIFFKLELPELKNKVLLL